MTHFLHAERYASGAALVAGGSGGLGAAICRTLAEAGSNVALTYHRNHERAVQVADEVKTHGRRASIAKVDLADDAAVNSAVADAIREFGSLHTLIYAAGPYVEMRFTSQISPEQFRDVIAQDLFGFYSLVHAALPELRKTRGVVVALSSAATQRYLKKDLLSVAPKAGVEAVVKAIAAEEGRHGIRANAIGVGVIADGMYHALRARGDFPDQAIETIKNTLPLGKLGTAQDVADAVAFLACDRSGFTTGQVLAIDGGFAF